MIYNRSIEDDVSIKGINNVGSESNNDATLTGNLSANAKLLSDLTPPVTPDSTPMSIGNSPNFKQQPQSFLLLNQSLVTKKHVRIIIIDTGFNIAISFFIARQYIFQQVCLSGCVYVFFFSLPFCLYCIVCAGNENQTFHTRQSVATELK